MTKRIFASGATPPANLPVARPAAMLATCVPWPSLLRDNAAGTVNVAAFGSGLSATHCWICSWLWNVPKSNPSGGGPDLFR